ncbi:hypothetical protein [Cellulomonas sp. P5_C5]
MPRNEGPGRRASRWADMALATCLLAGAVAACSAPLPAAPAPSEPFPGDGAPAEPFPTAGGANGAPDAPPPPDPTVDEPAPPVPPPTFDDFLTDCEQGAENWREGQLDFPAVLVVDLGEEETYVAVLDLTDEPAPPTDVVPGPSPTSASIQARCVIAARLTPLGDGLEVDEGEWRTRQFTPVGSVRWAWSVEATDPGDGDVRLELRPAVEAGGDVTVGDDDTKVLEYVTTIQVRTPLVRQAGDWWNESWGTISAIAIALAGAYTAVRSWLRRNVVRRGGAAPTPPPPSDAATPAG